MPPYNPTIAEQQAARRDLIKSISVLTFVATTENSLAARNMQFHCDQFLIWMDAFYSGKDPSEEPNPWFGLGPGEHD